MSSNIPSTRKIGATVLLAALGLVATQTNVSAVRMEVSVLANGVTWARVVPGSNTGGRVVWSNTYWTYITDRVSRGETVWVDQYATYGGEYAVNRGYTSSTGTVRFGGSALPGWIYWSVPGNPSVNLSTWVQSNVEFKSFALPIGTRP